MKKIEILAPAGNIENGYSAISAGCDAIYGGLEFANARQRAKNFSLSEYKKMLDYCREKNVKFYLAMNTLLRTEEIEKITDLLKKIDLPDAVIAADLGLMIRLKELFPSLAVHASTQFGAYSLNDIKFLESIGASRAILSRELTLDEIKYIKGNSSIELEVFVFGTQCTMFSGQCLWGGLVTECSGNRGKCNGMCRDFYSSAGVTGQLMYPRDLEIGNHIKLLEEIGVTSAKIEGRLRPGSEIKHIIETIRSDSLTECYSSYLSGALPVRGMFCSVNPRVRYTKEFSERYSGNDLLLYKGRYVYGNEIDDHSECHYIKTVYHRPITDGVNISVKLKYEERTLKTVSFISTFGEKKLIPVNNRNTEKIKVCDLCGMILKALQYNVYELISEVPDLETADADIDVIHEICTSINEQCRSEYHEVQGKNTIFIDRSEFIIETNKAEDIIDFSNGGYENFIFDIESEEELAKALSLTQNIVYKLPVLDFKGDVERTVRKLAGKSVMLTKISQLMFLKKYGFKNAAADYSVNCWNEQSIALLKKHGVAEVTIHPELELEHSIKSIEKSGLTPCVIIAGNIPLGFSRACFGELNICSHKCNETIRMKNISKGYDVFVDCSNDYGFRTLYRDGTDVAFSCEGTFKKRILISRFSEKLKNEFLKNDVITINNPNYLYRRNVK